MSEPTSGPADQSLDAETEVDFIEATVVDTIDSRELIIDAGASDGVELGMRFAILGETTVKSNRAESGFLKVRFKKTIVKIVRILDDFHSVGRTFKVIPGRPAVSNQLAALGVFRAMDLQAVPDHVETLSVATDTPSITSRISADDRKVRPGDIAEQTWGEEYEE